MKYTAIIEPADDGRFSVYVPDLPGCVSTVRTREEAIESIREAIQDHVQANLFIAGCVTLLLFTATHLVTMFAGLVVEPTKPVEVEAKRAMAAVAVDMGPLHTSWLGLNRLLSASYSTLLLFVAVLNLVALPAVIAHGRLRAVAAVNVIFVGILLAIAVIYQFPPPGVFCLIAEVFFIAASGPIAVGFSRFEPRMGHRFIQMTNHGVHREHRET